jgi:HSP20 family protein
MIRRWNDMAGLLKREQRPAVEPFDWFARFDRLFEDWARMLPSRRPLPGVEMMDEIIRIDEFQENGTLVIRAELPGIDPEKDVEVTVADRMLHIRAERREEEESKQKGYTRRELRYGSFARTLPLPEGVSESDIVASYKDGILEIRVPVPEVSKPESKKITITKG